MSLRENLDLVRGALRGAVLEMQTAASAFDTCLGPYLEAEMHADRKAAVAAVAAAINNQTGMNTAAYGQAVTPAAVQDPEGQRMEQARPYIEYTPDKTGSAPAAMRAPAPKTDSTPVASGYAVAAAFFADPWRDHPHGPTPAAILSMEEHRLEHVRLHKALDELVADYIACQPLGDGGKVLDSSVFDLLRWSLRQARYPDTPSVARVPDAL